MDRTIQEEWNRRFHGKTLVESKYTPKFPLSNEREYLRLSSDLMSSVVMECLKKYLPKIRNVIVEVDKKQRLDSKNSKKEENQENRKIIRFERLDDTIIEFKAIFDQMENDINSSLGLFNLAKKLQEIGESTERFSKSEWKKVVNKTLGVNILDDYYQGEYYQKALGEWTETNAGLIKSIPKEFLDEFKDTVYQEYISGSSITDLSKQIRERYGVSKSKSRMLARDQVGKLNAQITQHQQQNVGSNKYKWKTTGDGRVRSRHKELNNKICSWDDPPVVDKRTGRKAHPGDDYQCRCIAIPVFDLGQINIGAVAAD